MPFLCVPEFYKDLWSDTLCNREVWPQIIIVNCNKIM